MLGKPLLLLLKLEPKKREGESGLFFAVSVRIALYVRYRLSPQTLGDRVSVLSLVAGKWADTFCIPQQPCRGGVDRPLCTRTRQGSRG